MPDPRILIAAGVVLWFLGLVTIGLGLNAFEQMKAGHYDIPKEFWDTSWKVFGAALACLVVGIRASYRKQKEKGKNDESDS